MQMVVSSKMEQRVAEDVHRLARLESVTASALLKGALCEYAVRQGTREYSAANRCLTGKYSQEATCLSERAEIYGSIAKRLHNYLTQPTKD